MPVHDWSQAAPGMFHYFHNRWMGELCDALNFGVLPRGYLAIAELNASGVNPDVLVGMAARPPRPAGPAGGAAAHPRTRFVSLRTEAERYTARTNRIAIRTTVGELVAIVEIVSPGNKGSQHAIRSFRDKVVDFLRRGVHVSLIDLLPPSVRDPQGIHKVVWDEVRDEPFELPPDKPLTIASYIGEPVVAAFVEPVAVGDVLPRLPIFLEADSHISVPLEEPYARTWEKFPDDMKAIVFPPPA